MLLLMTACGGDRTAQTGDPVRALAQVSVVNGTASFGGARSNYTIVKTAPGYTITDNVGSDGVTVLGTVESLRFVDVSINLAIASKAASIDAADLKLLTELYVAFFNRVPDADGLAYWIDQYKLGKSIDSIADSFYAAAVQYSTLTGYSATMSNADFVRVIYKNVLGRSGATSPPDADVQYWSNQLASGQSGRGRLIRVILTSAHTFLNDPTWGWVPQLLDNKAVVANTFSVQQGLTYNTPEESISKTMAIAALVTSTNTIAALQSIDAITVAIKITTNQAARFLAQATFGPSAADINDLIASGYGAWIDIQASKPRTLHRSYVDSIAATLPAGSTVNQNQFHESFWQQAATGEDQLRQRVTFALSEIFVVSLADSTVANYPRGVASYYDMLAQNAFGNYRTLLEQVSLHPMMGVYLTSLHNQKASGTRVPDENYAREVMQLMSIGLLQLNQDGTPRLNAGKPIETYTNADITAMARVFTGWSWAGPDKSDTRFNGGNADPDRDWKPMQSYPKFHATTEKSFLGTTVGAQGTANPEASLKIALDTLFNHPNVGPFIGRQLIQRLVTSNPSPAYVARVAATFADNGQGVRGDMKALVKAVLTDPDARNETTLGNPAAGKLREPVVRLAHWMRAFNAKSTSGRFLLGSLDDPLTSLGQTPMRSPSVFNFFRPGYAPPNTTLASSGLVAPEMQITGETSVVGYLNFMADVINNGTGSSRDIKPDYSVELALADKPEQLLDRVDLLLMAGQMPAALRSQILMAISGVAISATNATTEAAARKNRVNLAIFLTMASPDYLVQK
ncbi:MAG: DUF1800 family protein [Herminiimonas sp.]|nr:DUF1800 family protein [Herminiimonas sp.]